MFKKTHVGKKWCSKQADHKVLLNEDGFQESMYNTELSVVEPNGADAENEECFLMGSCNDRFGVARSSGF